MANICWKKLDIDNRAKALESTKGLLHCFKISWTLVHKRLKTGPEFLPTLTILFRPSPSYTFYAAWTWRPTATLNETASGLPEAQIWSPRRCYVGNAIASGGLKWQYIAIIATFSSYTSFRQQNVLGASIDGPLNTPVELTHTVPTDGPSRLHLFVTRHASWILHRRI